MVVLICCISLVYKIKDMKTRAYRIKTKKQIEANGFIFVTMPGGAIIATNDKISFRALTLKTLRKKISFYLS